MTKLINLINSHYNIGTINKCTLLHSGDNDIYRLETKKNSFIARISKPKPWIKNLSQIRFELELLNYLKKNELPVISPILNKKNNYFQIIKLSGINTPLTIFPYISGFHASPMSAKQSFLYGQTIASIHQALNKYQPKHPRFHLDLNFLINNPIKWLTNHWGTHWKKEQSLLYLLQEKIHKQLEKGKKSSDIWNIIGGDFHQTNVYFNRKNEIICFDFDTCGYGWMSYDLATFLWDSLLTHSSLSMKKNFFQGYQSKAPLSSYNISIIKPLIIARHIWYMGTFKLYLKKLGNNYYNETYWNKMFIQLNNICSIKRTEIKSLI